jgi:hypothetical protein
VKEALSVSVPRDTVIVTDLLSVTVSLSESVVLTSCVIESVALFETETVEVSDADTSAETVPVKDSLSVVEYVSVKVRDGVIVPLERESDGDSEGEIDELTSCVGDSDTEWDSDSDAVDDGEAV